MKPQAGLTDQEINAKVGRIMRETRKKLKLTQADVAQKIAVSQSLLSKIENGRVPVMLSTWLSFCVLAGLPLISCFDED